jgi:hypothetical protein
MECIRKRKCILTCCEKILADCVAHPLQSALRELDRIASNIRQPSRQSEQSKEEE